ncbi:MAG: MBL fold metallo-hydrolase, partial [Firmicutes bacterium]|nr:MBL fold metallo-hydrolase [Bacillota bacterium]
QVVGPSIPGRAVVICGDTRPTPQTVELARGADVLVHEATFCASEQEHANRTHHSTASETATIARSADVRTLILTHVSPRYTSADLHEMLAEAQAIFPQTVLAQDQWSLDVPMRPPGLG